MKTRTYQDLDPNAPPDARYLCVLTAGKASIFFHDTSALAAQTKAQAWWDEERRKAGQDPASQPRKYAARKPGRPKKSVLPK